MLRTAAKNFASVTVVTEPGELRRHPRRDARQRRRDHARDAPRAARPRSSRKTSAYDNAIWMYLSGYNADSFPDEVRFRLEKVAGPALRREPAPGAPRSTASSTPRSTRSRAPSSSRARSSPTTTSSTPTPAGPRCASSPSRAASSSSTPTRAARASTPTSPTAYRKAQAADPISAYGGVMAFNRTVPASRRRGHLREQAVRRGHDRAGLRARRARAARRASRTCACCAPAACARSAATTRAARSRAACSSRSPTRVTEDPADLHGPDQAPAHRRGDGAAALRLEVAKSVKSNAILLAKDFVSVGVGAGQMNRVNSARIAVRAGRARTPRAPLRERRVHAVPGLARGRAPPPASPRSSSPAARCATRRSSTKADELGVAMVFTGHRHFRH